MHANNLIRQFTHFTHGDCAAPLLQPKLLAHLTLKIQFLLDKYHGHAIFFIQTSNNFTNLVRDIWRDALIWFIQALCLWVDYQGTSNSQRLLTTQ